jgi:hypothetical protein
MTSRHAALGLALLLAAAFPAHATDARPKRAAAPRVTGFLAPQPIYKLTLGRGQSSGISQPKKIVKAVSGDPTIVEVGRFQKATPTIGLQARGPGVTNVLVWTSDAQVHTYRVTVK